MFAHLGLEIRDSLQQFFFRGRHAEEKEAAVISTPQSHYAVGSQPSFDMQRRKDIRRNERNANKWSRRYRRAIPFTGSEGEVIEHLGRSLQFHERDADALPQIHVNGHVQMIEQVPAYPRQISHHGYLQESSYSNSNFENTRRVIPYSSFVTLCFLNSLAGPTPEIRSSCGVLTAPAQRITSFLTPILPTEPFLYITLMPSTLLLLKSTYEHHRD